MGRAQATENMTTAQAKAGGLDDVLLAMDVVDTLRHRQHILDRELDAAGREAALVTRLREIYKAQGIDVPDDVLREGVKALAEQRFAYAPPKPSLQVTLARLYVSRHRWLQPLLGVLAALIVAVGGYQLGIAGPERARAKAAAVELTETLPDGIDALYTDIQALAEEPRATTMADAYRREGRAAIAAGNVAGARAARDGLANLKNDLEAEYNVTIVSRPGAMSGVFRIPDDVPGGRNYYLIVEAIDGRGQALPVTITSEEDQTTRRVTQWGVRVPKKTFDAVAADKQDDQIIQNAVIGRKEKGRLTPTFTVPTEQGAILEW